MGAHILKTLLSRNHSVVAAVRSESKAAFIRSRYPDVPTDRLGFTIIPDISVPNTFDDALISNPPFEAIIHTASPYHFNATAENVQEEMLDPAVNGTTGILKSIQKSALSVKRVVITSSSAAITDTSKPTTYVYSEKDWNPVTLAQASTNGNAAYRASKTFAERAAWDFVANEHPKFTLVTMCPPLVLGPVIYDLKNLKDVNTSNERIRDIYTGAAKDACPPTRNFLWVDVRDIAMAHALAVEKEEAGGNRFFVTAGNFCNKEIVEIIGEEWPTLREELPRGKALEAGEYPVQGVMGYDNSKSKELLGLEYGGLKEAVLDSVKSLMAVEEKERVV